MKVRDWGFIVQKLTNIGIYANSVRPWDLGINDRL